MNKEKKLNKYSEKEINEFIDDYTKNKEELELNFVINDKPVPYARARFSIRTKGFYNPKAACENQYKKLFKDQLTENEYKKIKLLLSSATANYTAEIYGNFYVPTQTADSAKTTILKERQIIRPDIRNGDIDNYMKLVLDALHDVIYNDDKIVSHIEANKYYSVSPRSEIRVKLIIYSY